MLNHPCSKAQEAKEIRLSDGKKIEEIKNFDFDRCLIQADLENARKSLCSSVSGKDISRYEQWNEEFGRIN